MTGHPQPSPADGPRWHLVVPVKEAGLAKTRLELPGRLTRPALARAVAEDTLREVCRALPPQQVTVVTTDARAARVAEELGARVVPDPGAGLDAAVTAGLAAAESAAPEAATRTETTEQGARTALGYGVLLGDLPCLRAEDLRAALAACADHGRAVVPDADGSGTVLLTAVDGLPRPRFGAGSAARHGQDAVRLDLELPRLRRDVDTATDLAQALCLGVGPCTAALLAEPPA